MSTVCPANAVIKNCLIPLTKAHPAPDTPHFAAVDVKAVAEFLVDHVVQFFTLFCFVLREERAQDTMNVENIIEVPYSMALHEAFPGTYHTSMTVNDNVGLHTTVCMHIDAYKTS